MAIDAQVAYVEVNEDGSGALHLCDRIGFGRPDGNKGQPTLRFDTAPHEVTALNGLAIWGGSGFLMLGDIEIAERLGYTRLKFHDRDTFLRAVAAYHQKRRDRLSAAQEGE